MRILGGSGAKEFHCSARHSCESVMTYRNGRVAMGAKYGPPEFSVKVAGPDKVSSLVTIGKNSRYEHN